MEKKQVVTKFIERVFFLLAGMQVFLGLVWVVLNITHVPRFGESQLFLQAAEDFVLDEYMGILYPVLLRITSVAGEGYCVLIYLLQLVVAFVAYSYFLRTVLDGFFRERQRLTLYLWAGYILTFPMILQCHMSVLPYSLASSMLVLVLARFRVLLAKETPAPKRCVVSIGVFWMFGTLLLPDYGLIVGLVVLCGFVMYGLGAKNATGLRFLFLTFLVAGICMSGVLALTQAPGSLGRIQKSAGSMMLSRFAWPYMERNSFFWSEEVKEVFSDTDLVQISLYPERIIYEFGPGLEAAVGKERANSLYWEMALTSLKIGKKEALTALGRDVLANVGGPFTMQLQGLGVDVSYTGWNYARMAEYAPKLTKYYVRFAGYSFDFMLFVTLIVRMLQKTKRNKRTNRCFCSLTLLLLGLITIWYTMIGNGMQDYLKVIPLNIFWCLLPVWGYGMCLKSPAKQENEIQAM